MKRGLAFIIAMMAWALTGCDGNLTNFVSGTRPGNTVPSDNQIDATGPMALKRSPAAINSTTSNGALKANITLTNRVISGNGMAASISISRSRVSPQ